MSNATPLPWTFDRLTVLPQSELQGRLQDVFDALSTGAGQQAQYVPWIDVSVFTNGWTSLGGAYAPVGYYKDAAGIVRLRGAIQTGTLTAAAFTLPAGYRPGFQHEQATGGSAADNKVSISTAGVLVPFGSSNTYVYLDNVSFRAGG